MIAQLFSKFIRSVIVGEPWGEVFPGRPAPPPPADDGRTAALSILRRYISELTFYRDDANGRRTIPFKIPIERIHLEWPDDAAEQRELPQLALISGGPIDYQSTGLGSWVDESTAHKFGKNTVLQVQSENVEPIFIDMMCKTKQERRSLREGIKSALSPTEFMAGIRFRMPDFYDQKVTFVVNRGTVIEDENSSKNRRQLRLDLEMSYLDVKLVNCQPMIPIITTLVDHDPDDPMTAVSVDVDADTTADQSD